MHLGQWDVSLDTIKQTVLTEAYIMQSTIVHYCSGVGGSSSFIVMAAVVIVIAHKHTFRVKEKNILTSRAVFANHSPRIGILNGKNDSAGCVRGGREEYAIILSFFLYLYVFFCLLRYRPFFTLSASFNAISVGYGI